MGHHLRAKQLRHSLICRKRIYKAIRDAGGDPRDVEVQQPKAVAEPKPKEVIEDPSEQGKTPVTPRGDEIMLDDLPMPERPADPLDHTENEDDVAEVFGDFNDDGANNDESMADVDDTHDFHREVDAADEEMDRDHEMVAMMDVLQTLGVDVEAACRFSSDVIRTAQRPTVTEVYGTGNIIDMANTKLRNLNIDGLCAFDLRVSKPDGSK